MKTDCDQTVLYDNFVSLKKCCKLTSNFNIFE